LAVRRCPPAELDRLIAKIEGWVEAIEEQRR